MSMLDLDHSAYLIKPFDLNELAARIEAAGKAG
jgi:DNA-binding response OmpR family regulator